MKQIKQISCERCDGNILIMNTKLYWHFDILRDIDDLIKLS